MTSENGGRAPIAELVKGLRSMASALDAVGTVNAATYMFEAADRLEELSAMSRSAGEVDERGLEAAAKRLCLTCMGGDNDPSSHSRIALAWGMRADKYRGEARAAITAYLAATAKDAQT